MLEFTKDTIPEEIINDECKFNEATFFIFHYRKLDVNELLMHYQKYGKESNIDDYIDNFNRYFDYFNDMKSRNRKALESTYVRKYGKELYKKMNLPDTSLTDVKHRIASTIGMVIREASYLCLQNLFKESYMDLFLKTIQDDGLKELFETFLIESFPFIKKKGFYQKDLVETYLYLYATLHGSYLIEINKEYPDFKLLEKYQNEIKQFLGMNEEELLTETKKRKALLDEILKWNNHAIQQYYDELEKKESTEPFAVLNQSINPADYIDTGIDEFEENLPELNILTDENLPIKIKSLTALTASEDKFQRYFNYLNEENSFNDYMKEMHTIFFRFKFLQESKEHFEFGDYCAYIIMDEVCKVYQKECSVDHIAFYARDFIFLLAYWLMPSDSSKTMQMIDYFKEIMNQNEKCQEHFNDFRNTLNEYRGIAFTPDTLYYLHIIASVLLEIENSTVSRKVKQYFLKIEDMHQLIDNLPEYSQKYRYFYEQDFDLTPYLHNMAIVFLFSYFADCLRIAPYSAFAEYAKARILDKPDLKLNTIEEVLNNQATDTCSLNIRETAKKLDELIETINDSNDSAVIDIFENVLTASQKNNDLYLPLPDFQEFIKQHYNQLIRVLMTFQKIDTDSIIQACIYFMLIEKFDTLAQFMPKDVSLVSSEVIKQKEENNLYLESRLADQEKVIMALQNQVKQQKAFNLTKEIDNVASSYKKEIADLKKQLCLKDDEMCKLKENNEELFKLRELMYLLKNEENDDYAEDTIDLKALLINKNVVLVGGHMTLIDKLKTKYPTLKIMQKVSEIKESVLVHADHIFLFYHFMTHSHSEKVLKVVSKYNIPYNYIPYTNLSKTEEYMKKVLS